MTGKEFHGKAEMAREKGEFVDALKFTDEAMMEYQTEGDVAGFAEIQASRFLTLRHLYDKTGDKNYLVLAKHNAEASAEIAENSNDPQAKAMPYFNLAKIQEELAQYPAALDSYSKAIENMKKNPPEQHNRPGVLADFKGHMAVCEYKAGDKTALERAEEALEELKASGEMRYNKDVWMSGAYMKMAEAIKDDDSSKASTYLDKAGEIIESNPELILRKEQLQKLRSKLSL
jgi:tetratricopeptide (TPR) repeat protein